MKRKVPRLRSDAAAEAFLDQDLSNLDFSQFRPTQFEFDGRVKPGHGLSAQLSMRLPVTMLEAVKCRASARGIPYTRFIREAVEHALAEPRKTR